MRNAKGVAPGNFSQENFMRSAPASVSQEGNAGMKAAHEASQLLPHGPANFMRTRDRGKAPHYPGRSCAVLQP